MKIRVFATLYVLSDTNGTKYTKEKVEMDFPSDINIEAAYAEIHDKHGKLGRDNRPPTKDYPFERGPYKYAEIHGYQLVDPNREKVVLPTEKSYQADLLSGEMLQKCRLDSPNLSAKRKRRHRSVSE